LTSVEWRSDKVWKNCSEAPFCHFEQEITSHCQLKHVAHRTALRRMQRCFVPAFEKCTNNDASQASSSWCIDETYVNIAAIGCTFLVL
jgi:transposase-like protein